MQIGIFAKTFPGTAPQDVLEQVRDAGFTCAQYNMACSGLPSMPDKVTTQQAHDVASAAKATGVTIAALSGTFNMIHPDREVVETGMARLKELMQHARTMGTDLVTLCTGTRDPEDQWRGHSDNTTAEAWTDLCKAMERALQLCETYDLQVGVEPELANVVNSAQAARRLLDEMQSDRLRIVFDPANLYDVVPLDDQRRIVSTGIDLLADRIVMAHAKDRAPNGDFLPAGKGTLDYAHFLTGLKASGFDGPLVTHGLDASDAAQVATFLKDRLAVA